MPATNQQSSDNSLARIEKIQSRGFGEFNNSLLKFSPIQSQTEPTDWEAEYQKIRSQMDLPTTSLNDLPEYDYNSKDKSVGSFLENLRHSANTFATGAIKIPGFVIDTIKSIYEEVDYPWEIFLKSRKGGEGHESHPTLFSSTALGPLAGLYREIESGGLYSPLYSRLRGSVNQVKDMYVEQYKDGIWEAFYKDPLFVFLDATAVASFAGKGVQMTGRIVTLGKISSRMRQVDTALAARVAAKQMTQEVALATSTQARAVITAKAMRPYIRTGELLAHAPYLPLKAPIIGLDKLMTGPLAKWRVGKVYSGITSMLMIDKWARKGIPFYNSIAHAEKNFFQKQKIAEIFRNKQFKFTPDEERFFWDRVLDVEAYRKAPIYSAEDIAGKFAKTEEIAQNFKLAMQQSELEKLGSGYLGSTQKMKIARAKGLRDYLIEREAVDIAGGPTAWRKLTKGEKSQKLAVAYEDLQGAYDDKWLNETATALKTNQTSYYPFLADWDTDFTAMLEAMTDPTGAALASTRKELMRRRGFHAVDRRPLHVIYRAVTNSETLLARRRAVLAVTDLEKNGGFGKLVKRGEAPPEGYSPVHRDLLYGKQMDAEQLVSAEIARDYEEYAVRHVKAGLTEEAAHQQAMMDTFKSYGVTTDSKATIAKLRDQFDDFFRKPSNFDTQMWVPKSIHRMIEWDLATPGILGRAMGKITNIWRTMTLQLMPRYYINNIIGNAFLSVFSGTSTIRLKKAGNPIWKEVPEAYSNSFNQATSFANKSMLIRNGIHFFEKHFEANPRIRALMGFITENAELAKLSNGIVAARTAGIGAVETVNTLIDDFTARKRLGFTAGQDVGRAKNLLAEKRAAAEKAWGELEEIDKAVEKIDNTPTSAGKRAIKTVEHLEREVDRLHDFYRRVSDNPKANFLSEELREASRFGASSAVLDRILNFLRSDSWASKLPGGLANNPLAVNARLETIRRMSRLQKTLASANAKDAWLLDTTGAVKGRYVTGKAAAEKAERLGKLEGLATRKAELEAVARNYDPLKTLSETARELEKTYSRTEILKASHEVVMSGIRKMETFFGNYASLHPIERKIVNYLFPFWTFTKTMFALQWRAGQIRPLTASAWIHFSRYLLDSSNPENTPYWLRNALFMGGSEESGMLFAIFRGANPLDYGGWSEAGGLRMPDFANPANKSPFVKFFIEVFHGGYSKFRNSPIKDGEQFMLGNGKVVRFNTRTHTFEYVTPTAGVGESLLNLLPHWNIMQEFLDPNNSVPKDRDGNPVVSRRWWWAFGAMAGFRVKHVDPAMTQQLNQIARYRIRKALKSKLRYGTPEDRAYARVVWDNWDRYADPIEE